MQWQREFIAAQSKSSSTKCHDVSVFFLCMFLINWLAKGRIIFCLRSFSPENVFISQSLFLAVLSLIPISIFSMEIYFYRPQTKFAKVMFLQVSVCPRWGGGDAQILRQMLRLRHAVNERAVRILLECGRYSVKTFSPIAFQILTMVLTFPDWQNSLTFLAIFSIFHYFFNALFLF